MISPIQSCELPRDRRLARQNFGTPDRGLRAIAGVEVGVSNDGCGVCTLALTVNVEGSGCAWLNSRQPGDGMALSTTTTRRDGHEGCVGRPGVFQINHAPGSGELFSPNLDQLFEPMGKTRSYGRDVLGRLCTKSLADVAQSEIGGLIIPTEIHATALVRAALVVAARLTMAAIASPVQLAGRLAGRRKSRIAAARQLLTSLRARNASPVQDHVFPPRRCDGRAVYASLSVVHRATNDVKAAAFLSRCATALQQRSCWPVAL